MHYRRITLFLSLSVWLSILSCSEEQDFAPDLPPDTSVSSLSSTVTETIDASREVILQEYLTNLESSADFGSRSLRGDLKKYIKSEGEALKVTDYSREQTIYTIPTQNKGVYNLLRTLLQLFVTVA